MLAPRWAEIGACVFDAYGTLFDYASATARSKDRLGGDWQSLSDMWRRKQLEYSWLRTLMGRHADFWHVTAEALDYALAAHKRDDPALRAFLMQQYFSLDPFPDVVPTMEKVRAAGLKTAILSNGAQTMLVGAVNSAKLSDRFDAVLSVEPAGVFKPHPSAYQVAVDRLALPPQRICFLSSNAWDAVGAAAFGFRVIWVNRARHPAEKLPASPELEIASLAELDGALFGGS
jgi:2-haloacid dehalogenase